MTAHMSPTIARSLNLQILQQLGGTSCNKLRTKQVKVFVDLILLSSLQRCLISHKCVNLCLLSYLGLTVSTLYSLGYSV